MEIVLSQPADLPAIVDLLKKSLGETLMPKSEAFFRWKHFDNSFGASKILLAKEQQDIIGLRAFMYWDWMMGDQHRKSVRAVDTATDPAHQGKGIFKKLTLMAVESCKAEGVDLVFNSPNPASRAGYLKMGWVDAGRMPVLFKPGSIFPKKYTPETNDFISEIYSLNNACAVWDGLDLPKSNKTWYTPLSVSYLKWRYRDCPTIKYGAIAGDTGFGMVFRIKSIKSFRELRICEIWAKDYTAEKKMYKAFKEVVHQIRPLVVSCASSPLVNRLPGFFGPFQKGPVTTVRELKLIDLSDYLQFKNWQPSLGSMEVF